MMGFLAHWVSLIMGCVSTVRFSVMLNGQPCFEFALCRGLRQGYPLSPYPFILCREVLSAMLRRAIEGSAIHEICITLAALVVSHLFFVDDSVIYARATVQEALRIQENLQVYERGSG